MPLPWNKTHLGELVDINPNSIGKTYPFDEILYMDISGVGTGTADNPTLLKLKEAPSRARRLVSGGDTIISTVRPNRRSFLYLKKPSDNLVVSTGFAVLHPKLINPRFLYYIVTNQSFTDYLALHAKGAAYPAVDAETISRAEVLIPSIDVQNSIADVLGAYDDLIENNTQRIQILEQTAQAIYKEWFVNFQFPGHEKVKLIDSRTDFGKIPKEWEVKKLSQVAEVISGYAFKSSLFGKNGIPVVKIKNIMANGTVSLQGADKISEDVLTDSVSKFILSYGDIVVAMTGATAGKVGRISYKGKLLLNQRVARIEPKENYYSFVWGRVGTEDAKKELYRLADGAAQPNMSGGQIEAIPLLVPSAEILSEYERICSPILKQILVLEESIGNLSQSRDLLIPKLVTGEIRV